MRYIEPSDFLKFRTDSKRCTWAEQISQRRDLIARGCGVELWKESEETGFLGELQERESFRKMMLLRTPHLRPLSRSMCSKDFLGREAEQKDRKGRRKMSKTHSWQYSFHLTSNLSA